MISEISEVDRAMRVLTRDMSQLTKKVNKLVALMDGFATPSVWRFVPRHWVVITKHGDDDVRIYRGREL